MPTSVFLSHSSQDKPFVRELADFLEKDPSDQIKVWLDERQITPGSNIVTKISTGLASADFVILILSPASVNTNWVTEEWTDAFWTQTNTQQTKIIPILYRDCSLPPLLRNKAYLDLRTNHLDGFRQIKTFLLTQQPVVPHRHINQLPSRPPLFIGREPELAELRQRLSVPGALVHIAEMAGQGKTSLALECAHRYQTDFESVYWLPCQSGSLNAIVSDLERQLGLKLQTDAATMLRDLKEICSQKRCLLILDNVDNEAPAELIPGGAASVLVTTRHHNLRFLRGHHPLNLPLFTQAECFDIFRRELGAEHVNGGNEGACLQLFGCLGYLPFGITVAAALIREDVRYTIAGIAANLPADVKELIQQAMQALEEAPRHLLSAMAACAPEGFALSLAAEIAGFDETAALNALQPLVARSLAEELNRNDRRYRIHALVRETADAQPLAARHADIVDKRFAHWEANWRQCEQDLPDFQLAFTRALTDAADNTASHFPFASLYTHGYLLTSRIGRPAEAFDLCERLARLSAKRNDSVNLHVCYGNMALILQEWGRLEEAMALQKEKEKICLALDAQHSLQLCYGNQALILQLWGRLDEALALHKQEEKICLALGNQDGLARSYGHQALIHRSWGQFDEAMSLHKQEEQICRDLGDLDGLSATYGNQASILFRCDRQEEALALFKKQEELALKIGNQSTLAVSYGNQAVILRGWDRSEEAMALHKKEEEICLALGHLQGLQASYGNQSQILQSQGQLSEALFLLGKQEEICRAIGSKEGLAKCYLNWGLIERELNHPQAERDRLAASLALFDDLKMTSERDAVKAEYDKSLAEGSS